LFNRLNISPGADISCVLENEAGETVRSTQPVTLYITAIITPLTLHSTPSIPTEDDGLPVLPAEEDGNNKPQSREEASPASTEDLRLALDHADQAMNRIDRSNTWQGAVGRIKWVMDTLSPIAEVGIVPFCSWLS
jgi:hypothetical protein